VGEILDGPWYNDSSQCNILIMALKMIIGNILGIDFRLIFFLERSRFEGMAE